MAIDVPSPPKASLRPRFAVLLIGLGAFAFGCAWMSVASVAGGRAGWMVLAAALNSIAWLRISGTRPGSSRALAAVLVTAVSIALGEWLVASLPIASAMGQFPWQTAGRMGADFGWMLIRLGNTPMDWLTVVFALMLAACFGR